jgi:hypothetical protein
MICSQIIEIERIAAKRSPQALLFARTVPGARPLTKKSKMKWSH